MYSLAQAAVTHGHRQRGRTVDIYFSQVWRLEKGASVVGWILVRTLLLASDSCLTSPCPHVAERESRGVSHMDTNPVGWGPTLRTPFNLSHLLTSPFSKYSRMAVRGDVVSAARAQGPVPQCGELPLEFLLCPVENAFLLA